MQGAPLRATVRLLGPSHVGFQGLHGEREARPKMANGEGDAECRCDCYMRSWPGNPLWTCFLQSFGTPPSAVRCTPPPHNLSFSD